MAESRIVPADEKTCPAHLYNAEGYRQLVAFKFKVGDKVRGTKYVIRGLECEVTGIAMGRWGNAYYGLDSAYPEWPEDCLELIEEAR